MKNLSRISLGFTAFLLAGGLSGSALATDLNSGPYSVTASVNGAATLTVNLFKNDVSGPNTGPATALSFGQLQEVDGTLRSSNTGTGAVSAAYLAQVTANTHGLPYTVKQTGTTVSSGANQLPNNGLAMNVVYVASDNGNVTDGTVGSKDSWVGTKTLYTSSPAGPLRTIRAYYAITPDPAVGPGGAVPLDQPSGTYNGTITYTLTY